MANKIFLYIFFPIIIFMINFMFYISLNNMSAKYVFPVTITIIIDVWLLVTIFNFLMRKI